MNIYIIRLAIILIVYGIFISSSNNITYAQITNDNELAANFKVGIENKIDDKSSLNELSQINQSNNLKDIGRIIINWEEIPSAVCYEIKIIDDDNNIIYKKMPIFATGVEIKAEDLPNRILKKDYKFQIRGLDLSHNPINDFSTPKSLVDGKYFNENWFLLPENRNVEDFATKNYLIEKKSSIIPIKLTSQYQLMKKTPILYPTYSWVPIFDATHYQIQIYKTDSGYKKFWRSININNKTMDYYDDEPFIIPGKYLFSIIALDKNNNKIAESNYGEIIIPKKSNIVAIGDSITHGGGAISTPPSSTIYNWTHYANIEMINAGFSGNTTSNMLKRFSRDVLSFHPKIVLIMGGINDIRLGIDAEKTISNLEKMRDIANNNEIIPIFITMTSINPGLMGERNMRPTDYWIDNWIKVNNWIKKQQYNIDINNNIMLDNHNFLPANMTTDGLHPDAQGKKIIGEKISNYLKTHFNEFVK